MGTTAITGRGSPPPLSCTSSRHGKRASFYLCPARRACNCPRRAVVVVAGFSTSGVFLSVLGLVLQTEINHYYVRRLCCVG